MGNSKYYERKFQITKQDEENKQTRQWKTGANCFFVHEATKCMQTVFLFMKQPSVMMMNQHDDIE